jgi:hypothetical protein
MVKKSKFLVLIPTLIQMTLIAGLAVVDITYLFFVSFECFFVLHGTLWHDVPVTWCSNIEEDDCIHLDVSENSLHQDNHLTSSKSIFETDPFLSYPWRK